MLLFDLFLFKLSQQCFQRLFLLGLLHRVYDYGLVESSRLALELQLLVVSGATTLQDVLLRVRRMDHVASLHLEKEAVFLTEKNLLHDVVPSHYVQQVDNVQVSAQLHDSFIKVKVLSSTLNFP